MGLMGMFIRKERLKTMAVGITISLSIFVGMLGFLVAFDMRLHRKFDKRAALNYRGYRGEILGRKDEDEVRVGLFGGSVAMGYGVENENSISGFLQRFLDEARGTGKCAVVNLAATKEYKCAYFKTAYSQFDYLDLDILIFYLWEERISQEKGKLKGEFIQELYSERTASWTLRNFNYYFILPTVSREKYYLLRYGNISEGYYKDKFFQRVDSFFSPPNSKSAEDEKKDTLYDFVTEVTGKGKIVVFALAPFENADYWGLFKTYLKKDFSNNPNVIIADLEGAFSENERAAYLIDGLHYNENGNSAASQAIVPHMNIALDLIQSRK